MQAQESPVRLQVMNMSNSCILFYSSDKSEYILYLYVTGSAFSAISSFVGKSLLNTFFVTAIC